MTIIKSCFSDWPYWFLYCLIVAINTVPVVLLYLVANLDQTSGVVYNMLYIWTRQRFVRLKEGGHSWKISRNGNDPLCLSWFWDNLVVHLRVHLLVTGIEQNTGQLEFYHTKITHHLYKGQQIICFVWFC